MTGSLTGKAAVITGAARGLGREYAIKMAAEGAAIVAGDVRSCDETVAAISKDGGQATGVELDVADPASCDNAMKIAADLYGKIDVLVNNAALYGGLKGGPFDAIEIEEWDRCMAVNVTNLELLQIGRGLDARCRRRQYYKYFFTSCGLRVALCVALCGFQSRRYWYDEKPRP